MFPCLPINSINSDPSPTCIETIPKVFFPILAYTVHCAKMVHPKPSKTIHLDPYRRLFWTYHKITVFIDLLCPPLPLYAPSCVSIPSDIHVGGQNLYFKVQFAPPFAEPQFCPSFYKLPRDPAFTLLFWSHCVGTWFVGAVSLGGT